MEFKGIFTPKKFFKLSIARQKQKLFAWAKLVISNNLFKNLNNEIVQNFLQIIDLLDNAVLKDLAKEYAKKPNLASFDPIYYYTASLINKSLNDSDLIIYKADGKHNETKTFDVCLVLDNLRSSFNTGSITRTAECAGAKKIYFCGTSPAPSNPKTAKIAMETANYIEWEKTESTIETIKMLKQKGYTVYGLETTKNSTSIYNCYFKQPVALVFGNEALGISKQVLAECDEIVSIPLYGWKNSLNVGVCCGIALFEVVKNISIGLHQ